MPSKHAVSICHAVRHVKAIIAQKKAMNLTLMASVLAYMLEFSTDDPNGV